MDFAARGDWSGYFKNVLGKPPRETLLKALAGFDAELAAGVPHACAPPFAIDLAAGEGRDSLELLRRGWIVLAIEMMPEGIRLLREQTPLAHRARLHTQIASFADAWWPACDLFNSSFALPFCPAEQFDGLWGRITASIRPGGRFAGQFFGDRDSWGRCGHTLPHSRGEVERLFVGFDFELLNEEEKDDTTAGGDLKHWHVFHIVARKRP
jgi:hypothetical protein